MSLTEIVERIETSHGETEETYKTLCDLKDHLMQISAEPTPSDWDKTNSLIETLIEQVCEIKGAIVWSRDIAKETQNELDQAYSIMQNLL